MKQLLLAVLLAAVASSATTLLLAGAMKPDPAPAAPPLSAADFKAALADLENEVAALRREMAERGPPAAPWTASPAPAGRSPGAAPAADRATSEAVRPATDNSSAEPTPGHLLRFRELFDRDDEGNTSIRREMRRRWLFRGEREVVEWFGIPETVGVEDGGAETWYYEIPTGEKDEDGGPVTEGFNIRLSRGRVIEIGG